MAPTVLLADDDQIVRTLVQRALGREGFLVLVARDGEEALALLRQIPDITVMVTDVYMGHGMSGIELAECALRERPGLPVLVISANLEYEPRALGKPLPFLAKPFTSAALAQAVREAIRETADEAAA